MRLFDVYVEDQAITGIDVWSDVGPNAALMKTTEVDSDNMLDIVLQRVTQNPSIKGIEVIAKAPRNLSPVVDAGANTVARRGQRIRLNGSVSDDALPDGSTLVSQWQVVSGPGIPDSVQITDNSQLDTVVRLSQSGVYTLELTATDGGLTATDTLRINVCRRLRGCEIPAL